MPQQTVFKHIKSGRLYYATPGSDREQHLGWNLVNKDTGTGFLELVEPKKPTSGGGRTRDIPEEPDGEGN